MSFTASLDTIIAANASGLLGVHPSWARVRLSEVAEILSGFPFASDAFKSVGGFPLIRIRDVVKGSTETFFTGAVDWGYVMQPGDLLVGMDGDFNSARWCGPPALLNQRVCRIRTQPQVYDLGFLSYALPGYLKGINDYTPSITVKHLSTRTIAEIPLPLPPLGEQRRIVAKIEELFSDLDAGVAALERVKANLKRYRAAVLKAAVEGRLTEEWRKKHPNVEPASNLLERILAERRAKWEADQLRMFQEAGKAAPNGWRDSCVPAPPASMHSVPELPRTWTWASAEQLAISGRPILYGIIKPGPDTPGGVRYVRVMEMKTGEIDVSSLKRCHPERAARFTRSMLRGGDVLISKDGTIGKIAVVPPDLEGGNITQHVLRLSPTSHLNTRYLVRALQSPHCQAWIKGETKGVALQGINVEDFRVLPIPLPPVHEQTELATEIDRRLSIADAAEAQIAHALHRAGRLQQAILKRAFEGRLVPQDPIDEPAESLLRRLQGNGAPAPAPNPDTPAPRTKTKSTRRDEVR